MNRSIANRLWILFTAGLAARLAVSVFLADNHSLYFEHMLIARNLLEGKGYSWDEWGRAILQPTSLVPPLYVYWCAFFQWLSPSNFLPMYVAQAIVSASGCVPAYLIGRRMLSERVGWIFAILFTLYPEFVFVHSKAVAESIYLVLVMWMLVGYLRLRDYETGSKEARMTALLTGLLSGTAMMFKEAAIVVAFAIVLALLLRRRPIWLLFKREILPFAVGVLIVLSPWIVRNDIVQGEFIPLRTAFGINWWVANHPGAAGNDRTSEGKYVFSELSKDYNDHMNRILPSDEQDRDRVYKQEVWRFIREHPSEYLSLTARRMWYWVWFVPAHALASNPVYRFSWILVLIFAFPGAWMLIRTHRIDSVLPLILIGYILYYVPTIVLPRYRVVSAMVCLIFASVSLDQLLFRLKGPRSQ